MTFDEVIDAVYRRDNATLVNAGRDEVNQADGDGRTPLMHAILAEHPDPATVRVLLQSGATPNATDDGQRWTALHFAARADDAAVVGVLLNAGAAVDPVDAFKDTPLWRAVFESGDDLGTIELLLAHGADPDRKNCKGMSPRRIAEELGRDDIVELLERGTRTQGG